MKTEITVAHINTEPARDRWGRYLIAPPDGGKAVPYTRATTVAKTIEDQHSLIAWKARVTAKGLGLRPELLKLIAVTEDRQQLDELVEQAAQAGGATERRDEGIALHRALELAFHGQPYPDIFRPDVQAVLAELEAHRLTPMPGMMERIAIHDDLKIAGTFDLILEAADGGAWIADIKTGKTLEYSGIAFATQLAIYAGAPHLYRGDGTREKMPKVSQTKAIVIHAQPNSAECALHLVDIAAGAELLGLALAVRKARSSSRNLILPHPKDPPSAIIDEEVDRHLRDDLGLPGRPPPPTPVREAIAVLTPANDEADRLERYRDNLRRRAETIRSLGGADQLAAAWPKDIPTLKAGGHTDQQLQQLERIIANVERDHEAPFAPPSKPATQTTTTPPPPIDDDDDDPEGPDVPQADVAMLLAAVAELGAAEKAWIAGQTKEAARNGHPLSLKQRPSLRRWMIAEALRCWAPIVTAGNHGGAIETVEWWQLTPAEAADLADLANDYTKDS